jgi:hypothetical protein
VKETYKCKIHKDPWVGKDKMNHLEWIQSSRIYSEEENAVLFNKGLSEVNHILDEFDIQKAFNRVQTELFKD